MKAYQLGEFEEIVLLTVGILHGKAYGVTIKDEIEERLGREVSVGALQTTLRRLEKKGFVTSEMGGASKERGGRRKRFFTLTKAGRAVLDETMQLRAALYKKLPKLTFSSL